MKIGAKRTLVALVLALATATVRADSVDAHIQVAQKLIRRGRLQDAKVELLAAQSLAPQRQDVVDLLASLQTGAAPAVSAPQPASPSVDAEGVEEALAQGRAAYRDSDLKGAAAAWQRALQLQDGEPEATQGLARLAAEAYRRDPDQPFDQSVSDLYDAGLRDERKGHLVEAKKKLDDALALNPLQPQVRAALASLAPAAQQEQASRDADRYALEGQSALKEGDWAKAGTAFQEALKQVPDLSAAKDGLAQVRARGARQADQAVALGQSALGQEQWDEAEKQFSLALAMDPDRPEALTGKRTALQHSAKARDLAVQHREADKLYNAGVEAWSGGDLGLAASRFREVLKVDAQDPEALKALAAVRKKLDERADKDRADALQLVADGQALEAKGAPEEALKRYERALAKDPSQADAAKAKDRLLSELKAP